MVTVVAFKLSSVTVHVGKVIWEKAKSDFDSHRFYQPPQAEEGEKKLNE